MKIPEDAEECGVRFNKLNIRDVEQKKEKGPAGSPKPKKKPNTSALKTR